ncbi:MAG TPA: 2-dehydropantoate 2-reductase [Candidatus Baltobacteraceae bacterium]|nr:2-dehydropantoate 2-reductase [Candidatus Baltobacteraceae bacterium]
MNIVVMGTGGLGGYFGGRLAAAGNALTFVARGKHLAAIQREGLRIESAVAPLQLRDVRAVERVDGMPLADVVIIAVKLWDTEAAAEAVRPVVGAHTMVVSFQNGVDAVDRIAPIVGRDHVIGGLSYIAAEIAQPGVVRHSGTLQRLVFGELDGQRSARVDAFASACAAAGIDYVVSGDIQKAIWEKFVFLVGLSAVTCVFRRSIGPIRSHPRSRALLREVMREVVDVARARGIALDQSFTDERLAFVDTLPEGMIASMYGDLQRGNRLELPWLSGKVVELGAAINVPTPANGFVTDALSLDVDGRSEG